MCKRKTVSKKLSKLIKSRKFSRRSHEKKSVKENHIYVKSVVRLVMERRKVTRKRQGTEEEQSDGGTKGKQSDSRKRIDLTLTIRPCRGKTQPNHATTSSFSQTTTRPRILAFSRPDLWREAFDCQPVPIGTHQRRAQKRAKKETRERREAAEHGWKREVNRKRSFIEKLATCSAGSKTRVHKQRRSAGSTRSAHKIS